MTTPKPAYDDLEQCVHCGGVITRMTANWFHASTGRGTCDLRATPRPVDVVDLGRHVPEPAPAYPSLLSPADHYAEADRLLRLADSDPSANWQSDVLAAAQVHATLALSPWGNYQQGASS